MQYLILGICLLAGFILLGFWFVRTEPKKVVLLLRWVLAILGLIAGGYLIWGGLRAWAILAVPFLLPILLNFRAIRARLRAARGPSPGQASEVETRFLRMTLDHDSGVMTGQIKEGRFAGRALEDLEPEDLVALWAECRTEDAQSAAVLEAYLDRTQGEAWRETAARGGGGAGPRAPGAAGAMSREEAYEILGIEPGANRKAIHDAHRRLMQKVHPDHGGSNYLAAKINQAKALLLGE
ncbi:MAG: DnaJ domain-containing protein [Alphaproteobacteria bacterium]